MLAIYDKVDECDRQT